MGDVVVQPRSPDVQSMEQASEDHIAEAHKRFEQTLDAQLHEGF